MTRAFVFPGQGSQKIGMGQALADAFEPARDVFARVDEALSDNLSALMWTGEADQLQLTHNAQPALMAVSLAVVECLKADGKPIQQLASHVAGHSLGEYSALAAVEAFDIETTAKLLRKRGEAMQSAVPVGEGAMAAVLGLSIDQISDVIVKAQSAGVVVAANDNADGQIVISGTKAAVDQAADLAKEAGARKVMPLPVSAPFHSPLMQPAADVMAEALDAVTITAPLLPVIQNVPAAPVSDPAEIKANLVEQVCASVRWRESVAGFRALGITDQVEIGAGKVLSGLVRRIDRDIATANIETPEDLEAFAASL